MRVRHLNCATLYPLLAPAPPGGIGCHCLLVETADGLVLVDTGLGLADTREPTRRLPWIFRRVVRPALCEADTALRQIERLGHGARDVRHIVLTHLDVDHAGGLPDFPDATVHVLEREHAYAMTARGLQASFRHAPAQWSHGPRWALHEPPGGETFLGLPAVRVADAIGPDLLIVPLPGHSPGHVGVAVRADGGWLLHVGDAYFHRGALSDPDRTPPLFAQFARAVGADDRVRARSLATLRELVRTHPGEVRVISAHDPEELGRHAPA